MSFRSLVIASLVIFLCRSLFSAFHKATITQTLPPSPMVAPLGKLLSETWSFVQANAKTILIGAVVFGLVMAGIQFAFFSAFGSQAQGMLEGMGMNVERMEDLAERMEAGDEAALEEMMGELGNVEAMTKGQAAGFFFGFLKNMAPGILLLWLISIALFVLSSTYYLLVALKKGKDFGALFQNSFQLFLPMLWLHLWVFLRTFAWIPFIGMIPLIILGPRFVLSPVLLVQEGKGVFDSARISYKKTSGYWGKIFGNMFVAALIPIAVSVVLNMALILVPFSMVLGAIVMQAITAFMV